MQLVKACEGPSGAGQRIDVQQHGHRLRIPPGVGDGRAHLIAQLGGRGDRLRANPHYARPPRGDGEHVRLVGADAISLRQNGSASTCVRATLDYQPARLVDTMSSVEIALDRWKLSVRHGRRRHQADVPDDGRDPRRDRDGVRRDGRLSRATGRRHERVDEEHQV